MSQHSANIAMLRALGDALLAESMDADTRSGGVLSVAQRQVFLTAALLLGQLSRATYVAADKLEANEPKLRDEGQFQFTPRE